MSLVPSPSWGLAFGVGFVIASSFDIHWFLRLAYTRIAALFRKPISVTDESVTYSICATTDIDYFCHMNNGRYLRELDFARFDFYFRTGLSAYFRSQPNIYIVQHAASIRYRRSIDFLTPFMVQTRLIWFDERSLYFEQKFVSLHDNFIRAIALCKNTAVNCDVIGAMRDRFDMAQPVCPEDLAKFIESNDISSNKLKMSGHQMSVATNLSDMDPKKSI